MFDIDITLATKPVEPQDFDGDYHAYNAYFDNFESEELVTRTLTIDDCSITERINHIGSAGAFEDCWNGEFSTGTVEVVIYVSDNEEYNELLEEIGAGTIML